MCIRDSYKYKYLQFLNNEISTQDESFIVLEEFFETEIAKMQEQEIPEISVLQKLLQEFANKKVILTRLRT